MWLTPRYGGKFLAPFEDGMIVPRFEIGRSIDKRWECRADQKIDSFHPDYFSPALRYIWICPALES